MEDCPNAKRGAAATAAASLLDELILEILSRVTARSIHRFKCVSKHWRDLIADPLHQKRLPQTLEGFFCSHLPKFDEGRFIRLPGRSAPLVDPGFSLLMKQPGLENIKLLCSCNGLVLFEHRSNSASTPSYAVCNPATEQWVAVPSAGLPSHGHNLTYLIFDPAASPHFHLVHVWQKDLAHAGIEVHAYSSETRLWRERDRASDGLVSVGGMLKLAPRSYSSAFVNGTLHFIVTDMAGNVDVKNVIVAMGSEGQPRIIQSPNENVIFVAQSQGRLHCMTNACRMNNSGLSIWVLEDYDAGHWVLKHRVSFLELFGEIHCHFGFNCSVVCIHPDRDLAFFIKRDRDLEWKLLSYDMNSKQVHVLHNIGYFYCSPTPYVPYLLKSLVLANKH